MLYLTHSAANEKRRGTVAALVAVTITLLLGIVAITLDGGLLQDNKRRVQNAADGAALAAATVIYKNYPSIESSGVADPGGYAADAAQVYYRGVLLTKDVATFQLVGGGYAKTATQVYFYGKSIPGADAASFTTLEKDTGTADARDRNQTYRYGEKSQAQ